MKGLILVLLVGLMSGCSTLETLGDYVKDNPVKASFAFRYATAKYIDSGKTDAIKDRRANEVVSTSSKVLAFIDDNPTVSVSDVMQYLDAVIDWGSLDVADRMLVNDILQIVEADLSVHETQNPLVNIRELLDTVISAALLYGR
jgi:hypothetical protein